jgi:hypothetical protein
VVSAKSALSGSNYWPIGFIGVICFGLIGLIGLIGLSNLSITSLVGSSATSTCQLIGFIGFVIAAKSSGTRSCHVAIKCYQNRQRGILLLCLLIASRVFAREGDNVVVARSRQEKDVAVDSLFW